MPQVYEARNRGMYAYVNYRQLVTKPLKNNNTRLNNYGPTRVQEAVNAIESTESTGSSPLPSPLLRPNSPRTPPRRSTDTSTQENPDNSNYLRPRGSIKYPK